MNWITHLRQRSIWLLLIVALVLSLALAACGEQANASNSTNNATNSYSTSQQYQSTRSGNGQGGSMQGTDQQVQSLLRQLDSGQNDVNSSDAAAAQDGGQQP